jgi:hypothetical protein
VPIVGIKLERQIHIDTADFILIRIRTLVANRASIPRFATTGITAWETPLECRAVCNNRINPLAICSQIKTLDCAIRGMKISFVAIRGTIIFFMAISGLNTAVCHGPRYTFESGLPQKIEIQYQPFYIDSPPAASKRYGAVSL